MVFEEKGGFFENRRLSLFYLFVVLGMLKAAILNQKRITSPEELRFKYCKVNKITKKEGSKKANFKVFFDQLEITKTMLNLNFEAWQQSEESVKIA
jgi:hypothetical protein